MNRTICAGVFAAFTFCCAALHAQVNPQPAYEGKPLAYWVERLRKCEKDEERYASARAIIAFGPDARQAVPALVEMLDDRSKDFRQCVDDVLSGIGPAAKDAVPALTRSLKERTARSPDVVIRILARIGPDARDAVPVLIASLEDPELASEAVSALCAIGPPAKEAAPAIGCAFRNNKLQLGRYLIHDLAHLGGDAVPPLVELLSESEPDFQEASAETLGELGPAAKAAVPALKKALSREDASVRVSAACALWKIDKDTSGVPVLTACVKAYSGDVPVPGPNRDYGRSVDAAHALGEIGPAAKAAIPTLTEALRHKDAGLRITVASALWKIDKSSEVVPVLTSLLQEDNDQTVAVAAEVLGRIGPAAKSALPDLKTALRHRNRDVCDKVREAIAMIDPTRTGATKDR